MKGRASEGLPHSAFFHLLWSKTRQLMDGGCGQGLIPGRPHHWKENEAPSQDEEQGKRPNGYTPGIERRGENGEQNADGCTSPEGKGKVPVETKSEGQGLVSPTASLPKRGHPGTSPNWTHQLQTKPVSRESFKMLKRISLFISLSLTISSIKLVYSHI